MGQHFGLSMTAFLLSFIALTPLAEAHYLWIETPSVQKKTDSQAEVEIYYGEFEEFLREKSGGRLDEVGHIDAWLVTPEGDKEMTVEKAGDYFKAAVPETPAAGARLLQLQELDRPVQDWTAHDIGIVKPNYYAGALDFSSDTDLHKLPIPENKTALAIYPVSLAGEMAFKVFFKNEPFSNAKFNVHAPNGWSKEYKTDKTGTVRFLLPWPGRYVFEVIYLEKQPGVFQGVSYEAVRHRATFSWEAA